MKQTDYPDNSGQIPATRAGHRPGTPGAYLTGIAGGAAVALIGVWLVVAPFAFGYQPDGVDWIEATTVGVITGIGLLVAGLAVTALLVRALRAHLAACGYTKPKPKTRDATSDPGAGEPAQGSKELEDVLVPLAEALLEDLRTEQEAPSDPTDGTHDGAAYRQPNAPIN